MKIAIASGKGGTGKTTIATNFAYILSKIYKGVSILDCDVEQPICHIFLKPYFHRKEPFYEFIPDVDHQDCSQCGKCSSVCEFNAISFINKKVIVFPELCHGCGSCQLVCPSYAIFDGIREIGVISQGYGEGFEFIQGELRIGETMPPPLIKAVKEAIQYNATNTNGNTRSFQIINCPPGTSCSLIEAIKGVDHVFLVTEPTPFGLHDLQLTVEVIKKIGIPYSHVINRSSSYDYLIEDYAISIRDTFILKVPEDRRIAEACSRGDLFVKTIPEYKDYLNPLLDVIRNELLINS